MHRDGGVSWFAISLAVILFLGNIAPIFDFVDTYPPATDKDLLTKREYTQIGSAPHNPIVMDGDANFSATALAEGWLGDGSSGNPYIIDGLTIDSGGGAGHCINISNTRVNFTIQNCNLTGASANAGIFLSNVSHGSLINNTSTLNRHGIYIVDSSHNTIANNTFNGNSDHGANMYDSDFNTVTNNDCNDNGNYGMRLYYCDSNVFSRNLCGNSRYDGIHARYALFNIFEHNTCNGNRENGIEIIYYSSGNMLSHNVCNANRDYGILIDNDDYMYPAVVSDNICSNNDYGLYIARSRLTVARNVLTDNFIYGIEAQCDESTISHNFIEGSDEGIRLTHGNWNTLSQNTIIGSYYGIWVEETEENLITQNSISETINTGISVGYYSFRNTLFLNEISVDYLSFESEFTGIYVDGDTSENNVTLNYILNYPDGIPDTAAIRDDCTDSWGTIIDRNWYEDYGGDDDNGDGFGEDPYDIPGSAGNSDLRPLVHLPHAPSWIETPTDQVIDYWSQPFYYDLNATAPSPITWLVNDTSQFAINSDGVVQSITQLPVGTYGLRVKVTNIYGVNITSSFQLAVREISLPEWIAGPMDLVINYGEGFDYGLIATDESGIAEWTINDTVNFTLSGTRLNVTGYYNGWHLLQIANATTLMAGVYPLNVTVVDPYRNALTGIFTVTVEPPGQDMTAPIWIVAPVNEILEYRESFVQRLGAWDSSGVDHWWLNETTHFSIDENGVIRNVTVVEPGVYKLEVRAYDPYDNYCSATLVLTVNELIESPTTTTTSTTPTTPPPTDTTIPTSPSPPEVMGPVAILLLVAGISGAAVVVTVIVLLRRKS
ncbi:MAG: NosD domain-containing protein [Candidatus Thorarchaeota archaeon]|jgi:parallel beta-helix repeat protein